MDVKLNPKFGDEIELIPYNPDGQKFQVNLYKGVQAGFPSPADDFIEQKLSLDERYVQDPNATYFVRVKGNSMNDTLKKGDICIVKSDKKPLNNEIAIFSVNYTDYTIKRFDKKGKMLIADNPNFPNIELKEDDNVICFGVVRHIIRDL